MDNENKEKCPYCNGTGFDREGRFCLCITGELAVLDTVKALFGDAFREPPSPDGKNGAA